MANATAWLKAHWKPVAAISVVVAIAFYFLVLRKKAAGTGTTLTLPTAALGGGGSGPGGSGSAGGTAGGSSDPGSGAGVAGGVLAPVIAPFASFMDWLNQPNRPDLVGASQGALWGEYVKEQIAAITSGAALAPKGFLSFTAWLNQPKRPDLIGASQGALWGEYVKEQTAALSATAAPAAAGAIGQPAFNHQPAPVRGSGFRGGDIYPAFTGQTRALGTARQARASGLPAAPLGTPMQPKQPTAMDVRRAPRRQTDIAQINRGPQDVPLPQSFSVVIRQTNPEQQNSIFKRPGKL